MTMIIFLRMFSLAQALKRLLFPYESQNSRLWRKNFIDIYVFLATGFLVYILKYELIYIICTIYLMAEMLVTTLGVQFVDYYDPDDQPLSINRSIILLIFGYLELILGYASLYLAFGGVENAEGMLNEPLDAFYYSCVTITTLGYGDWTPISPTAKFMAITETLAGIILIVLMLGTFLNKISSANSKRF